MNNIIIMIIELKSFFFPTSYVLSFLIIPEIRLQFTKPFSTRLMIRALVANPSFLFGNKVESVNPVQVFILYTKHQVFYILCFCYAVS